MYCNILCPRICRRHHVDSDVERSDYMEIQRLGCSASVAINFAKLLDIDSGIKWTYPERRRIEVYNAIFDEVRKG